MLPMELKQEIIKIAYNDSVYEEFEDPSYGNNPWFDGHDDWFPAKYGPASLLHEIISTFVFRNEALALFGTTTVLVDQSWFLDQAKFLAVLTLLTKHSISIELMVGGGMLPQLKNAFPIRSIYFTVSPCQFNSVDSNLLIPAWCNNVRAFRGLPASLANAYTSKTNLTCLDVSFADNNFDFDAVKQLLGLQKGLLDLSIRYIYKTFHHAPHVDLPSLRSLSIANMDCMSACSVLKAVKATFLRNLTLIHLEVSPNKSTDYSRELSRAITEFSSITALSVGALYDGIEVCCFAFISLLLLTSLY